MKLPYVSIQFIENKRCLKANKSYISSKFIQLNCFGGLHLVKCLFFFLAEVVRVPSNTDYIVLKLWRCSLIQSLLC